LGLVQPPFAGMADGAARGRATSEEFFDAVEAEAVVAGAAGPAVDDDDVFSDAVTGGGVDEAAPAACAAAPPPTRRTVRHEVPTGPSRFAKRMPFDLPMRYKNPVVLSSGTYGVVVSAVDTLDDDTAVAIKKISQPWGTDGAAHGLGVDSAEAKRHAELAYREIKVLKFLKESWRESCLASGLPEDEIEDQHPNLVAMRDCYVAETPDSKGESAPAVDVYLVLEHCGIAADDFCARERLTLAVVKDLAFQILQALQYMHSADIIHRDLKPQNMAILASSDHPPELDISILDFGLSRHLKSASAMWTDMDVVTREYRAPEVHFKVGGEVRDYGPAIDMWAFGIILAELLQSCSDKPGQWTMFQTRAGGNYLNVFSNIVRAMGVPPGEFCEALDEKSQAWLHKSFGDSTTQHLRDFLREPLGKIPFFATKEGQSDLDQAIDLIDSILKYDPKARLTAEEALTHPFFRDYWPGGQWDPGAWGKIKSSVKLEMEGGDFDADEWKEKVLAEVADFSARWGVNST